MTESSGAKLLIGFSLAELDMIAAALSQYKKRAFDESVSAWVDESISREESALAGEFNAADLIDRINDERAKIKQTRHFK